MSTTYSNRSIMVSHEHTRELFVSLVSRQVSKLFFNLPSVCKIEYIVELREIGPILLNE